MHHARGARTLGGVGVGQHRPGRFIAELINIETRSPRGGCLGGRTRRGNLIGRFKWRVTMFPHELSGLCDGPASGCDWHIVNGAFLRLGAGVRLPVS